jgi:FkbM family methyltransferase
VRRTFEILDRNITQNGLRNVIAHNFAVGAERGSLTMTLYSSSGNDTMIARSPEAVRHLHVEGTETVPAERLDDLLEDGRLSPPTLIKIDTEGAELAILRGAAGLLGTYRPTLILEHDEEIARDAGYTLDAMLEELGAYGYEIRALSESRAVERVDVTLYDIKAAPTIGTLVAFIPRNLAVG